MRFIVLLLCFISFSLFSQITISQNCAADIDRANVAFKKGAVSKELLDLLPINRINGTLYLSLLAKINSNFNQQSMQESGVIMGSSINNIITLKYPLSQLDNLYNTQGIDLIQVAGKIKPNLSKALWDIRADSVHQGLNLPQSFTGKNVLIGVTDWGFDYSHPMFYDTLLQDTRILAAWDQFKTSGPTPNEFSYGTEYSTVNDLINAGSDTSNIYSFAYHGTHVAGIAGGSGASTPHRGVAFESQYLFTTFLVDEASVMDAWQWMYDKSVSENKKLVINMSWGLYHTGALDGTSLLSQALDAFTDLGVLFVTSAGNNGDTDFHIKKTFSADTLLTKVDFYSSSNQHLWGQSIHAWGEPFKEFHAAIQVLDNSNQIIGQSPLFSTINTHEYIDSFIVYNGIDDTVWYNLSMDNMYPTNDRPQMRFRIKKSNASKIVLKAAAPSGTVHFWNLTELSTDVGNWGMPFSSLGNAYTEGDPNYSIGAPACSNTALTVASYVPQTNTNGNSFIGGQLSYFSSIGPLITETLKPDISGPGSSIASSISSYTDGNFTQLTSVNFQGRDYPFARLSGTSMSSPVVAGVAALIWEANPYLSPWQIKQIIITTAREDIKTGAIEDSGNHYWGFGKINAYAAAELALKTTGIQDSNTPITWTIYPNPTSNTITLNKLPKDVKFIQIFDINGRMIETIKNLNQIDVSHLTTGTYIVKIFTNHKVEQQKFIRL